MHNRMTMAHDPTRTMVRRRADGVAQIQALAFPSLGLGTARTLLLGAIGATLLVAALVMAPLWLAFGGRAPGQGRASDRASQGPTLTDLGSRRR